MYASTKVARKQWTCATCSGVIKPGERYRYSYKPGFVDERHTCLTCVAAEQANISTTQTGSVAELADAPGRGPGDREGLVGSTPTVATGKASKFERVKQALKDYWGFDLWRNAPDNLGWYPGSWRTGFTVVVTLRGQSYEHCASLAEVERRFLIDDQVGAQPVADLRQ